MTARESRAQRHALLKIVQALPHNKSTYDNWGCRCDKCKAARQKYDWDYNLTKRRRDEAR